MIFLKAYSHLQRIEERQRNPLDYPLNKVNLRDEALQAPEGPDTFETVTSHAARIAGPTAFGIAASTLHPPGKTAFWILAGGVYASKWLLASVQNSIRSDVLYHPGYVPILHTLDELPASLKRKTSRPSELSGQLENPEFARALTKVLALMTYVAERSSDLCETANHFHILFEHAGRSNQTALVFGKILFPPAPHNAGALIYAWNDLLSDLRRDPAAAIGALLSGGTHALPESRKPPSPEMLAHLDRLHGHLQAVKKSLSLPSAIALSQANLDESPYLLETERRSIGLKQQLDLLSLVEPGTKNHDAYAPSMESLSKGLDVLEKALAPSSIKKIRSSGGKIAFLPENLNTLQAYQALLVLHNMMMEHGGGIGFLGNPLGTSDAALGFPFPVFIPAPFRGERAVKLKLVASIPWEELAVRNPAKTTLQIEVVPPGQRLPETGADSTVVIGAVAPDERSLDVLARTAKAHRTTFDHLTSQGTVMSLSGLWKGRRPSSIRTNVLFHGHMASLPSVVARLR